jgi:predicted small secreted protein
MGDAVLSRPGTFWRPRAFPPESREHRKGTEMARVLTRALTGRPDHCGRILAFTALFLMALAVSGCNTVEGMGEDVSAAGHAVSGTADDAKDQM